jgi:hypothetical protein
MNMRFAPIGLLFIIMTGAPGGAAAREGGTVTDAALKKEFETIWAGCRAAFAEYRLDDLKKYVEIPKDAPTPTRAQAQQFAEDLPDLAKSEFLKLVVDGDVAGYYARTDLDKPDVTVAVIRFRKQGDAWQLAPAPHTLSIFSTDDKLNAAGVRKLIETKETLRLRPAEDGAAPSPPSGNAGKQEEAPDARPEPVIRKELEGIWRKIRSAFAAGKPDAAKDLLLWVDGATPPTPEEAKKAAKEHMPDLLRARFIKLVWSVEKPHLVGYVAEVNVGNAKKTTVALVVFARKDGAWKFAPGPLALEVIELPPTGQAALRKLVDTDPRFKL